MCTRLPEQLEQVHQRLLYVENTLRGISSMVEALEERLIDSELDAIGIPPYSVSSTTARREPANPPRRQTASPTHMTLLREMSEPGGIVMTAKKLRSGTILEAL